MHHHHRGMRLPCQWYLVLHIHLVDGDVFLGGAGRNRCAGRFRFPTHEEAALRRECQGLFQVVVVGGGRGGLDPIAILIKELRVLGSFTYADEFAEVIALLADGALQVADLTSEIASINDAPAAFERLRDASTMKILIAPNGS